jgi:hypothetical protein
MKVDGALQIDFAREVGQKKAGALEHTDQMDALAFIVFGDLVGDGLHALQNVAVLDADLQDVVADGNHRVALR